MPLKLMPHSNFIAASFKNMNPHNLLKPILDNISFQINEIFFVSYQKG